MFLKNRLKFFNKTLPGFSRSIAWEFLNACLTLISSILINRSLGAEDRGLFAIIILLSTSIFTIGTCQWEKILRGQISSKKISGKEAWRRSIYYIFWLSLIFVPLGILVNFIYPDLPLNIRFINSFYSCLFPVYLASGFLNSIYLSLGAIDVQYLVKIFMQVSYLLLVFISFLFHVISIENLIYIYIILQLIYLIFTWQHKEKLLMGEVSSAKPSLTPLFSSFIPNSMEVLSMNLDLWIFSSVTNIRTLGHYAAIITFMQPINLVSNAFISSSTARLDWTNSSQVYLFLKKVVIIMLCLLLFVIIASPAINPNLVDLLLGKSFTDGLWMIPWVAATLVAKATSVQFQNALQLSGLQNYYLFVQFCEPIIRLLLLLFLGWQFSEMGIMIGSIISSTTKCIMCTIFLVKLNN